MEWDGLNTAYNGTKNFSQHDVFTLNASGFGAAADDYAERGIDLNEQLLLNKHATYFFRMNSDAMKHAGIEQDDILIVDRSIKAENGKIVVAAVNGELMVRRFRIDSGKQMLVADNHRYANVTIEEFTHYSCWGVVTCVIHIYEPRLKQGNKPSVNNKYSYKK